MGSTNDISDTWQVAETDGRIDDAIKLLLDVKRTESSGVIDYNLGTLYLQSGDYASGRFYLEKALKEGFRVKEVKENLLWARAKVESTQTKNFLTVGDKAIFGLYELPLWAFSSFAMVILIAGFFVFFRKWRRSLPGWLALSSLVFFILLFPKLMAIHGVEAVAIESSIVREGPSAVYPVSVEIPTGLKVIVGTINGDYVRIRHPKAFSGWIEKKRLGFL